MKEGFYRSGLVPPEEQNIHQFRGQNLKDVIEYFEGVENDTQKNSNEENKLEDKKSENQSIFDGFLDLLRDKGVRVSTPEWLQFLQVIGKKTKASELKELVETDELLNKVRLFAQTTLVKDKADEAAFHEAFDEYFELAAKIYKKELQQQEDNKQEDNERELQQQEDNEKTVKKETDYDSKVVPELKEQLGAQEVKDNLSKDENHKDDEKVHGADNEKTVKKEADYDSKVVPELKEQLGAQEVKDNLSDENHKDDEKVHGGKEDQHNDILKREDSSKQGGGKGMFSEQVQGGSIYTGKKDGKVHGGKEDQHNDILKREDSSKQGGGKGESMFSEQVRENFIYTGEKINKQAIQDREKMVGKVDRRLKYETRPDKASMREVIRNIRKIILDTSEIKTQNVDLKGTVRNFAKRDFRFDYNREKEKQPEIVLLIDVGGPVDEWSPLVKEVTEAMVEGLTKLEVYLFHNNLYGYVWKPDPQNLLASTYAKPDSLIDIKSIIKRRKNVIIYGDAEMSYSELNRDCWPPHDNEEGIKKFGMGGEECLNFIKKKANSVVWLNPIFKKEWQNHDFSGTIQTISNIISMHDLSVGGVEDAIKDLMKQ
ncbi:hypothetical protein KBI31_00790 [Patescibacteria group bacterium]|nr:hypothetical protein [Patescibacteria group bacterium]